MNKSVNLSKEAISLLYAFFLAPQSQWKKEDHYPLGDFRANREVAQLTKWVDKTLLGPEHARDGDFAKMALGQLNQAYSMNGSDQDKMNAWQMANRVLLRDFKEGKYKLAQPLVERLKNVMEHYVKKTAQGSLAVHFADLDLALDGKDPCSEADVTEPEPEDKKEEKKAG